jgi:propionate CoA-transferase
VFCTKLGTRGRQKFVERVQQVTFSSARARRLGQDITYVTEKAVFRLGVHGLELVEVAPGLDVRHDVLDQLGCRVSIADDLRTMPDMCFAPVRMGLDRMWEMHA